jgi:hypothetical protein
MHGSTTLPVVFDPGASGSAQHRRLMRRISVPAGIRCGKRREQGRIKTVPEWRNWQTRQVQDLVLAREWRFESSFGHHTNQSKSSLPNPLLPLNLLRVQFIFPILYLLAGTAFATLGNSVIFGVLHAKARQRPRFSHSAAK